MKTDTLSSTLFNKTRKAVLALLLSHADESFYVRQIVKVAGIGQGTVQRELARLTEAGLLVRERRGNLVFFRANRGCPIFKELKALITKTSGAVEVLRQAFVKLSGKILAAFVHGSVAIGTDRAGSDLDLVVIGEASFAEVVAALRSAEDVLGREINPTVYSAEEYREKLAAKHHFVTHLLKAPKVFLIGDERDIERLGKKRLGRTA
jgi:DNA-binding transcriptional ArsR family regulator